MTSTYPMIMIFILFLFFIIGKKRCHNIQLLHINLSVYYHNDIKKNVPFYPDKWFGFSTSGGLRVKLQNVCICVKNVLKHFILLNVSMCVPIQGCLIVFGRPNLPQMPLSNLHYLFFLNRPVSQATTVQFDGDMESIFTADMLWSHNYI